jgi:hypothetical protein
MGKGDTGTARNMISGEQARVNNQLGGFNNYLADQAKNAGAINANERTNIMGGYSNLASDPWGGLNQTIVNGLLGLGGSSGGSGGGGSNGPGLQDRTLAGYENFAKTGGIDQDRMRAGASGFNRLMDNGGYSPERIAQINKSISGLQGLGETGGLDDTAINRFRGNGIYDEFAQTGGWSNQDKANFRDRTRSGMASQFGSMKNEMARRNRISGGNATNYGAQMAKAARQNAFGMGQALNEGELGMADQIRQGRMWGGQGMTNAENALQSLRTSNMLQGLTGAGNMGIGLQNSINQGILGGAQGLTDMEHGIQSLLTQNQLAGLGGMNSISAQRQAASQAAAARNAANLKWLGEMQMRGNLAGLGGMENMYGAAPGMAGMYNQQTLAGMGQQGDLNQNLINSQLGLANQPGAFSQFMSGLGGLTGAAGGLLGGLGAIGVGGNNRNVTGYGVTGGY